VRAILSMALRELTNVCLPAKILTVDERNGFVSLLIGLMLFMSVKSCFRCSVGDSSGFFGINLGLVGLLFSGSFSLDLSLLDWLGGDLVLRGNDSDLDCVGLCLDRYGLFHFIVGLLLSIEANHFVLRHAVLFFARRGNRLNKSNHGLVALGVKLAIVARFDGLKLV
jgi:hypothetical protein